MPSRSASGFWPVSCIILTLVPAAASTAASTAPDALPPGFTWPGELAAGPAAPAAPAAAPYPDLPGWPVAVVGGASPPVAADLDPAYPGLEVAVGTLNSGVNLYVFHADGTAMPGWPRDIGFWIASSPSIGDLDGDGDLEIVAGDFGTNAVWALHHDGTPVAGWPIAVGANVRSTAALADLDPSFPGLEVVIGVQDGTVQAWHRDGTPVAGWPVIAGNFVERSSPAVADVDGDGDLEVFVGSWYDGNAGSTGGVYGFNANGTPLPGWPQLTATHTSVVASPALADLDGDGDLEIAVGTYETTGRLFVWHHTGALMAGWPQAIPRAPASTSAMTSSPAIGDIDGDGDLEIVTGSTGQCGTVYAWHHNGTLVAGWPALTSAVVDGSSPVLGDVDGDGGIDIVVGSGSGFTPFGCAAGAISKAYVLHANGVPAAGWPFDLGTATPPHPALADIDGDGDTDIVLAFAQTVFAWDAPAPHEPARIQWPYFSFDIAHTGRYRRPASAGAEAAAPAITAAASAAPNPGAGEVRIRWSLAAVSPVDLAIFDAGGRLVRRDRLGALGPGPHEAAWDGRDADGKPAAAGVYFARLRAGGVDRVLKLALAR